MPSDSKKTLWENVSKLMQLRYGKERLTKLVKDAKVGGATGTRLRGQGTSIGIEVLEKLANTLEVQPWQLLVPGLDAHNLPAIKEGAAATLSAPIVAIQPSGMCEMLCDLINKLPDDVDVRSKVFSGCFEVISKARESPGSNPVALASK